MLSVALPFLRHIELLSTAHTTSHTVSFDLRSMAIAEQADIYVQDSLNSTARTSKPAPYSPSPLGGPYWPTLNILKDVSTATHGVAGQCPVPV